MNWLALFFAIELGFAPIYKNLNVTPLNAELDITENIGYVLFDAEVVMWDILFIGGATKTYVQTKDTLTSFHPFENDYLFNAGFRFGELEIGFRHFCLHPSRPFEIVYDYGQSTDASYEEFYIRVEVKR